MPTSTPRLGLTKPLTTEAYDVAVPNTNMDLLDAAPANVIICTSTTRPSTPDDGDIIYETDTTNVLIRQGGVWRAHNAKTHICTSSTRPTSAQSFGGMIIYETDTFRQYIRNAANSAWLGIQNMGVPTTQVFNATGTWTKPAGCIAVGVRVLGGGGSAGGCAATAGGQISLSGAGGGGGYAEALFDATALAATETVTVGAGGTGSAAGANAGNSGGTSSFATGKAYVVQGNGGSGGAGGGAGTGSGNIAGGIGGAAAGGYFNVAGGDGMNGVHNATVANATAHGGIAWMSTITRASVTSGAGGVGKSYGGGSAGCINYAGSLSAIGSNAGGPGVVFITNYF
jgi:hypothetical protein